MTIKHLVFSGGGPIMIQILGAIQEIEKKNFFYLNNIESIYGTSAGAIIGVLICLKFDWETKNWTKMASMTSQRCGNNHIIRSSD